MVLIYSSKITGRIRYIFKLIFFEILGLEIKFTTNVEEFLNFQGAKVSYHNHALANELFFLSKPLLFENDIKDIELSIFEWEGLKVFFPARNSSLPFDPFSASFYLVSRYEEYLPHIKDIHERFDAKESVAFQHGFITKPMINIWAQKIKKLLAHKFPDLIFPEKKYEYISTIDIDNAYAYKEKGLMRILGAYIRSIFNLDIKEAIERTKVLFGLLRDPYDTYDYQLLLQHKYNLKTIYFFLLADYGMNDKNIPVQNRKFQALIKSIADYSEVGIHPGFGSNRSVRKLQEEHGRLEMILNREVTKSRQHFLKLTLPETYQNLIDLDITDDYTMGYASHVGFRAGICTPFNFYDLDLDVETKLKIHPFAVMDATLRFYMKVSAEEAHSYINTLVDEVRAVNGTFYSLWHNESLSDDKLWKDWKKVYEEMVKYAS